MFKTLHLNCYDSTIRSDKYDTYKKHKKSSVALTNAPENNGSNPRQVN